MYLARAYKVQYKSKHIKDKHVFNGNIHFYYFNPVNKKDRKLGSLIKDLGRVFHNVQST